MTLLSRLIWVFFLNFGATIFESAEGAPARVMIYSATERFRHDSIPTAITALRARAAEANIEFDATEDRAKLSDASLSVYDAVMFLSTSGEGEDNALPVTGLPFPT
jgi:hypothetical protein